MGKTGAQEVPAKHQETLLYYMDQGDLAQAAQRGSGGSSWRASNPPGPFGEESAVVVPAGALGDLQTSLPASGSLWFCERAGRAGGGRCCVEKLLREEKED